MFSYANRIVVDKQDGSANDANPGTEALPKRTIQSAANAAQPGDTIYIHAGIYRERITPPRGGSSESMRITYMGAPAESVFVRGSDVWAPTWSNLSGNIFYAVPDEAMFNDNNYKAPEDKNPFKVRLWDDPTAAFATGGLTKGWTCGDVFVNGERYWEARPGTAPSAVTSRKWFYDNATGRLYICFPDNNTATKTVQITTRRRLVGPKIQGLAYITLKNIIFEHCGNNSADWMDNNYWSIYCGYIWGAVDCEGGHHWTIENCVVRDIRSIGIRIGYHLNCSKPSTSATPETGVSGAADAHHNIVRNCIVKNCGQQGINCSLNKNTVADANTGYCQIVGNWVENNDCLYITGYEDAGCKTHAFHNGLIADNVFINNICYGLWNDWQTYNSRITRNIMIGNTFSGIFYELTNTPNASPNYYDNNIVVRNGWYCIAIDDAQDGIFAHNLLEGQGATAYPDRTPVENIQFVNNLMVSCSPWGTYAAGNVNSGVTYTWNAATLTLTLNIANNLPFTGAANDVAAKMDVDFNKRPYGAVPHIVGPFQDLKQGSNTYVLRPRGGITPAKPRLALPHSGAAPFSMILRERMATVVNKQARPLTLTLIDAQGRTVMRSVMAPCMSGSFLVPVCGVYLAQSEGGGVTHTQRFAVR